MADFTVEQIHVVVLAAVYLEHKEISSSKSYQVQALVSL